MSPQCWPPYVIMAKHGYATTADNVSLMLATVCDISPLCWAPYVILAKHGYATPADNVALM